MTYDTFEDWFNELESFSLRSERFFADSKRDAETVRWLRAAFEAGKAEGRWNWWEFSDEVAIDNPSLVKPVDYFDSYAWFIRERQ